MFRIKLKNPRRPVEKAVTNVKLSIINREEIRQEEFYTSLELLPAEEKEALYQFFSYVRECTIMAKQVRLCGTSAEIHPYRSMINALAYGRVRPTLITDLAIIAGHELLEDCSLKPEEVKNELEAIIRSTNSGINTDRTMEGIGLLTRNRNNNYWTELERIVNHAIEAYNIENQFYSSAAFAKCCEAVDNVRTAEQLIPRGGESPAERHYGTVKKGLLVAKMMRKVIEGTTPEGLVIVEQQLVKEVIEEANNRINFVEDSIRNMKEKKEEKGMLLDYTKMIEEYRKGLEPYHLLKKEAEALIRPRKDYPYALVQRIPSHMPFHLPPDTPSAA